MLCLPEKQLLQLCLCLKLFFFFFFKKYIWIFTLLSVEPTVPARGRCQATQSTTISDQLKPKTLSVIIIKVFDLSSEHLRNTEFLEQRILRGSTAAHRWQGASSWTVWPRMKSSSLLSRLVLAGAWWCLFYMDSHDPECFLFMLAHLIQPQDRSMKEVSSLCHFPSLALIFQVWICTG